MQQVLSIGVWVKNTVLDLAAVVAGDAVPGLVVIALFCALAVAYLRIGSDFRPRMRAIRALRGEIEKIAEKEFAQGREEVTGWLNARKATKAGSSLQEAWDEFSETLFVDETRGDPVMRNSVRPGVFFNIDDLHFGAGFYRVLPGLFVSTGLALTFLGLIAALTEMAGGQINDATMGRLLGIASAKFIMSLTGLVCSIAFTIILRRRMGALDEELHRLCRALESRLRFASLEEIGIRQLQAVTEARDHQRQLAMEMVAELGRPLKEQQEMLPRAISDAIGTVMQPLLDKVSQQGTESMSTMAADLSDQVASGVGAALAKASESLSDAGERIGRLADRMDQSSGRMGSEMEQSVARVAMAVDELRGAMAATAQSTSGAFTTGAEQLLAVMNSTLEGIRDNTGEGARALSAAAGEMRDAAKSMRTELEGAARDGADAARHRMVEAGDSARDAIGAAGRDMLDAFGKTGAEIARMTEALSAKAGEQLLEPISEITERLDDIMGALESAATEMRRMSDSMKQGATSGSEAATSFRAASQELVSAAAPIRSISERIEGSIREMTEGTRQAVVLVNEASRGTAQSAAQTLAAAQETLSAERRGIEAALSGVSEMLKRMQGQGDRLDLMDDKLGAAFDQYTTHVDQSLQSLRGHVQSMSSELNTALQTLLGILDQLQEFQPQQGKS